MQKANKVANVFTKSGLKKGDVVLVMVPRLIEAYAVYIGALKAGLSCYSMFRNASCKRY